MAAAVVYTNFGGMLVHENRGGVETEYVNDTLGSLVECRNTSGTKTYDATYWPFGEIRTSTGTNPSPWAFVGLLGYLRETSARTYVRARYYRQELARWMSVDPLWRLTRTEAYTYVGSRPSSVVDRSGLIHPALAACLASGIVSTIGNLISGDSLGVALCKGVVSCAVAALIALILPIVGTIGGCLVGLIGSLADSLASRLCGGDPPCTNWTKEDKMCIAASAIVSLILGCIGAGDGEGGTEESIVGGLIGFIIGVLGPGCQKFLSSADPGLITPK